MTEPLFNAVNSQDDDLQAAHAQAAETIEHFVELVKSDVEAIYMAKLSFKDPLLAEQAGEDQVLYIWLSDVYYHDDEDVLSGVFFEVPKALTAWHKVGQRLAFEIDDALDWMVIKDGCAKGGYSLRAQRERLSSDAERQEYDNYIGIKAYEAL